MTTDTPSPDVLGFYVSVVDGPRYGLVAGPFRTKEGAEDFVEDAKAIGQDVDPRTVFAGWGTCGVKDVKLLKPGRLNERLGLQLDEEGFVR